MRVLSLVTSKNDDGVGVVIEGKNRWGKEGYTYFILNNWNFKGKNNLDIRDFKCKMGYRHLSKTIKGAERAARRRLF